MPKSIPYTYKDKHGSYYVRFVVPQTIRAAMPELGRDIRRSLRTKSPKYARSRSRRYLAFWEHVVEMFMMNPKRDRKYYISLITLVDPFGREVSIEGDSSSEEVDMAAEMQKRWFEGGMYDHLKDEYKHSPGAVSALEAERRLIMGAEDNVSVSQAVDMFIRDNKGRIEDQSLDELRVGLELFISFADGKSIGQINNDDIREFRELLPQVPKRFTADPLYQKMPLKQAMSTLDSEKNDLQAKRTVRKKFDSVRQLFDWACNDCRLINDDFSRSFNTKYLKLKNNPDTKPYKAFEIHHLVNLTNCYIYKNEIPCRVHIAEAHRFWVPMIALFTGARLEEICQLYLQDIVEENGIWQFKFTKEDVKNEGKEVKLKSPSAKRNIPIHPVLLKMGLTDYLEEVAQIGASRLFPELNNSNQKNKYNFTVTKWFGDTLRKEIGYEKSSRYCFHSFRKNVIQALQQLPEIPREIRKSISGHARGGGDVHEVYEREYDAGVLDQYLSQLTYPDLDFDGITWSDFKHRRREWGYAKERL